MTCMNGLVAEQFLEKCGATFADSIAVESDARLTLSEKSKAALIHIENFAMHFFSLIVTPSVNMMAARTEYFLRRGNVVNQSVLSQC